MKIHSTIIHIIASLSLWGALGWTLTSCSDTEDTSPSLADKDRLETLIDRSIPAVADFCDRYGTYILYNFDQRLDFAYQFEQATEWAGAKITKLDRPEAVTMVDELQQEVFCCYSDDFKKKFFPRKLLIVNDVKTNVGISLGRSEADSEGHHYAMANMNSVTLAAGNGHTAAYHSALLASYLVEARAQYPVGDNFFKNSKAYYSSLMTPNRTQARRLGADFFHERGFFVPEDDESTYFISGEADIVQYLDSMICMTQDMHDDLLDITPMAQKICLLANGLKQMGVDVERINPLISDFMDADLFGIAPTITMQPTTANAAEAMLNFILYRGAHDFDRVEVRVTPKGASEPVWSELIDLADHTADAKVGFDIELHGLEVGDNNVTILLYEVGRQKPAATASMNVPRVSLDNIMFLNITNSNSEHWTIHQYQGYDYTSDRSGNDVMTMRFYKRATDFDYDTGEEFGRIHQFWVITKRDGRVTEIDVRNEVIDYELYTSSYEPLGKYVFTYDDFGELQQVTLDGKVIVSDVAYMDGQIQRYNYKGVTYEPKYATAEGKTTRVDCLDDKMSGYCFTFNGNEDLNPYYISGLPAVIPGYQAEVPLQILYSQYLFTALPPVWSGEWVTDDITHGTQATLNGVTWNFQYIMDTW